MVPLRTAVLAALALLCAASRGNAEVVFVSDITHEQEVQPNGTLGTPNRGFFGFGTAVLNDAQTALTYTVTIFGIDVNGLQTPGDPTDNLTAAHIHAPGPPGVNAGIVFGFFGAPFNDNNPNDFVLTPFATGAGGTFTGKWDAAEGQNTTLTAQLPNLLAFNAYFNFHTAAFPGGEIRGQITPEPSTLALLGVGAAGLLGYGWRRRKRAA